MKPKKYFISFYATRIPRTINEPDRTYGWTEINIPAITGGDMLQIASELIKREYGFTRVIILYWREFEKEETDGEVSSMSEPKNFS